MLAQKSLSWRGMKDYYTHTYLIMRLICILYYFRNEHG